MKYFRSRAYNNIENKILVNCIENNALQTIYLNIMLFLHVCSHLELYKALSVLNRSKTNYRLHNKAEMLPFFTYVILKHHIITPAIPMSYDSMLCCILYTLYECLHTVFHLRLKLFYNGIIYSWFKAFRA